MSSLSMNSPSTSSRTWLAARPVIKGAALAAVLLFWQPRDSAGEDKVAGQGPSPEAIKREVSERMKEVAEAKVEVEAVNEAATPSARREAALAALDNVLREGPEALAQHALTFLSYGPPAELEGAVRERLGREAGNGWTQKHLRLSAQYYLARLGDGPSRQALLETIDDADASVRVRGYRILRDSAFAGDSWASPEVIAKLEARAQSEPDPAGRAAAQAAYAAIRPGETAAKPPRSRSADERGRVRGELEQARLAAHEPGGAAELTDQALLELARGGRHDERMFALEVLAERSNPALDRTIAVWAASKDWRQRLASAYYLVLIEDGASAARRLKTEENAFVQTALLSAVAQGATPAQESHP